MQEDASRGDLIDLKSLHEADIDKSSIENIVNAIERGEFESDLNKALDAKDREYALQLQLKENALGEKSKDALVDISSIC